MPSPVGFEFPIDPADQWDGFNDPGIEHFTGEPYAALGREVPQNVVDAVETPPAKIEVRLIEVPTSDVPGIRELRKVLTSCEREAKKDSPKAHIFFEQAIELVSRKRIKILQIADFNTTGVRGPCRNGTPYFALLKASGQSKKASDTSIGSFGIGKYAPFVLSGLRTVFVSTVWRNGESWEHYTQGKSILMSFYDDKKRTRKGTGFWGAKEKCLPVEGLNNDLPDWLLRAKRKRDLPKAVGTTLSIVGFDAVAGWQKMLAATMAENFFGAIERGRLEAQIDGSVVLSRETLNKVFEDGSIRTSIQDMKGEPDKFNNSKLYFEAISNRTDVVLEHTENQHLGHCELRILIGENLPKKVALLRDGMLITDELTHLRRFGEFKEFVAVFECQSTKGNTLLRNMEPPRHDDFEHERLPTDKDRKAGRIALREISAWVREMLKRHAQDPVSEVTSIEELKEFFAEEADEGSGGKQSEENPGGRIIVRMRPLKRKDRSGEFDSPETSDEFEGEEEGGGSGGGGGGSGGGERGEGAGRGMGEGGSNKSPTLKNTPSRVRLRDVRSIPLDARNRRIAFTPDYSGEVKIMVQDSGVDTNRKLQIASSSGGKIVQGLVQGVHVKADQRCTLDIELESEFDGAMRIVADAI